MSACFVALFHACCGEVSVTNKAKYELLSFFSLESQIEWLCYKHKHE